MVGALVVALGGCSTTVAGTASVDPAATTTTSRPPAPANLNAAITVWGTEPDNPLVPGNTTDPGGQQIIDALFTGLVEQEPGTNEIKPAHAQSWEVGADGKRLTIKLKPGWRFHDGTPVTAKNYVDAWNFTAAAANGQQGAGYFEQIAGYPEVRAPGSAVREMAGLKVVDDSTFTVDLAQPSATFVKLLGDPLFSPLPDAFFKDRASFELKPVGNGPFQFVSRVPGSEVVLARFEQYSGPKPKVRQVRFRFGAGQEAGYASLMTNEVDFIGEIPPSKLAGGRYKTELRGRSASADRLANQTLVFPLYDPKFANPDLRRAISMAIDRKKITETVFAGDRKPLKGYGAPGLPGWTDGACAEYCEYNPTKAKELFQRSGFAGPIELISNAQSGHKEWVEAVCNQIRNTLGADCVFKPVEIRELLEKKNAKQHTAIFRSGWQADYPDVQNFLTPIYRTGAPFNDGRYTNPAVDQKLAAAEAAHGTNPSEAYRLYREAEQLIAADMPVIPLWNNATPHGWSTRLRKVRVTPVLGLDLMAVEVE
ncbi:oligopeptide transport system substrate-binding protein [Herbihabitans rhizosphaerae]|uniref:Oligopeptide transport system substrate-binding protein n=1 Tax=Herbihabitans rhizosphaerae TaxID=1872711 RepID=A0A4V2ESC1_9PSEU|nr:oligopeptide transport system substrate-binding protein [Herbihabitans rhizosphaerae]